MVMTEALREDGFDVTEACSGDEAADLLADCSPFDVVLTDVQMPGTMDGAEVAIRARARHAGVLLVLVSGHAVQLPERLRGLEPPATFMRKPYRPSEVLDVLLDLALES